MIGALLLKIGAHRAWEAMNRRDLDYLDRNMAEDVVIEIPGRPPVGGRFVGRAAVREATQRWMDSLASFEYRVIHEAVTNPLAIGLSKTVLTEFELVESTHHGRTHRARGIDVSEVKGGKLVADRTYIFSLEAEEAIRPPAAGKLEVVRAEATG